VGAEELDRDAKRRLRRASKEERRKKRKQTAMAVGAAAGSGEWWTRKGRSQGLEEVEGKVLGESMPAVISTHVPASATANE